MYKNILIPVDLAHDIAGSEVAEIAKALGAEGAKYTVMFAMDVIPTYIAAEIPSSVMDENRADIRKKLAEMVAAGGLDADVVVASGHAAGAILDHADTHGTDCIVIASHHPGLSDYFLGSTAARVVRHAQCSVHVYR